MIVTIITLYREGDCEHLVIAADGKLTDAQKKEIAERLAVQPDDSVGFAEVHIHEADMAHVTINEASVREWYKDGQHTRKGRELT
jgi:hypothetical protein